LTPVQRKAIQTQLSPYIKAQMDREAVEQIEQAEQARQAQVVSSLEARGVGVTVERPVEVVAVSPLSAAAPVFTNQA